MARKYIKQANVEKGYYKFLIFITRYMEFANNYESVIGIRQKCVAKIINQHQTTVSRHIDNAVKSGLITKMKNKCYYNKEQEYPSNLYDIDTEIIKEFLIRNDINPFSDRDEAKKQVDEYFDIVREEAQKKAQEEIHEESQEEIHKETQKERKERLKKKKAGEALKEYTHNYYNQIVDDNNSRLIALGLGEYTDKYLTYNKLRATNVLCTTQNPDNHKNDPYFSDTKRYDCLRSVGINHPVEYDVNGSIYRLNYNLAHEEQLSQEADIYELIWDNTDFKLEFNEDVRKHLKSACMSIFMKEQSIRANVWNYNALERRDYRNKNPNNINTAEKHKFEAYTFFSNYLHMGLEELLNKIAEAMHKALGVEKFFGRDIFLFESDLHAEMKSMLMNKGIMVLNCYDGFYVEEGELTKEEFYTVYFEATDKLKSIIRKEEELQGVKEKETDIDDYDELDDELDLYNFEN